MSPRHNVREERTRQIIDAAMIVFAQKGFMPTRMEDIAKEAGLSKGTLYLYFKSKDELIGAILHLFFDGSFDDLQALLGTSGTVSDLLAGWTQQQAAKVQEMAAYLSISYEFLAIAARDEAVRQVFQGYYDSYRMALAALIQRGIDAGEFQPADTQALALSLMAVYEGMTLLWLIEPEQLDLTAVTRQSVQALLSSVNG